MNQQQCKILYDFGDHLEKHANKLNKTPFLSLQTLVFGLSIPNYLKDKCVRPFVLQKKSILDTFKIRTL